jgi:small subunit ribosomal protein S5e
LEEGRHDYATEVKLFGKWSYEGVASKDISLLAYINVRTQKAQVYLPYTAGRYQKRSFQKVNCPVVERLANSMMMKGRNSGKKQMAVRIVKQALEIIHLLTGENPLQILVDAIANAGAREDSTRIGSGGTVRRQAVDVSPLRRVNQAIYYITRGSRESSFRSLKSVSECLADEIIAASKGSGSGANSYAVKKKDEIERVAKGNR